MTELVVGIGMRPGVAADDIVAAVRDIARDNTIRCLATVDRRADEPGLRAAARRLGVPVVAFGAAELARVSVPNPSEHSARALGTPSVAEAAALLAGTILVVPKLVVGHVLVAAALCR